MALIQRVSMLVMAVLLAAPGQAEDAKAIRAVTFVLPAPVPAFVQETSPQEAVVVSEPTAATLPAFPTLAPTIEPTPPASSLPVPTETGLPALGSLRLPARSSPNTESQAMSLASTDLVRLGAATAGVLLLAVLVLSRLPKKVRQRASSGPSGVVEILARWPVAKGERLILVKFDRRLLLCHDAGQGWNRLCEVDDLTSLARITEAIEGKPERDAFRRTLEAVATESKPQRSSRTRQAALVETLRGSSTTKSERPAKRGVVVDLTKGRRVRITA